MSRFFANLHARNYLIRPMFHGVIHKITLAQFFWDTVYICVVQSSSSNFKMFTVCMVYFHDHIVAVWLLWVAPFYFRLQFRVYCQTISSWLGLHLHSLITTVRAVMHQLFHCTVYHNGYCITLQWFGTPQQSWLGQLNYSRENGAAAIYIVVLVAACSSE